MSRPVVQTPPAPAAPPEPAQACPNCGSPAVRAFCADCGQERPGPRDYALAAALREHGRELSSLDGRLTRTLLTLLFRPGVLTADHLAGRRARYLKPIQLFLAVNVLLFVLAPNVGIFQYSLERYGRHSPPSPALVQRLVARELERSGTSPADYTAAFDRRVGDQRKTLVIVLVPFFALLLHALFARTRRRLGEHLVFSLHYFSFLWLTLTLMATIARVVSGHRSFMATSLVFGLLLTVPLTLFVSLRRVYGLRRGWALLCTGALLVGLAGLLIVYRGLLFFTTYYTL